MPGIPEHLLRRSAEAKARATGRPVEEILAELIAEAEEAAEDRTEAAARREAEAEAATAADPEAPTAEAAEEAATEPAAGPAADEPAPEPAAAPAEPAAAPAAAATAGLPEHLLRRSAEAKARATGRPVEEILAEMQGGAPAAPAAPAPAAEEPAASPTPEPEPEPAAPPAPQPAPAAEQPAAPEPAPEPVPAAAAAGTLAPWDLPDVPEHLIARSRAARAKADGLTAAPAASTGGAAAPAAAAAAATATAPQPAGPPAIPEGVRTQRLLTVVKAGAIQQVKSEPTDKVNTWPHLIAAEFVALLVVTAALTIFSVFVDAPLLELANFNEQPNPSKAPWYFLGLQELLSYFDPQVAGVLIPGLGLAGLAAIPYVDRNPSTRPADRKLAIMVFTFFMMGSALLTIWGSFYRGPGFNFTFPWNDGLFFDF